MELKLEIFLRISKQLQGNEHSKSKPTSRNLTQVDASQFSINDFYFEQ